jgi:hypothetical protein
MVVVVVALCADYYLAEKRSDYVTDKQYPELASRKLRDEQ